MSATNRRVRVYKLTPAGVEAFAARSLELRTHAGRDHASVGAEKIMNWLKQIFSRSRHYAELSEEIREHLEERVEELVARGVPREEAERGGAS